jgi:aminopeptidase N
MLFLFTLFLSQTVQAQADSSSALIDILHYDAQIEPDITNKTVSGKIRIHLVVLEDGLSELKFDCGNLTIDTVRENKTALIFEKQNKSVKIILAAKAKTNEKRTIEIEYHGAPQRGLKFFPEQKQIYTIFSTSEWMVCIDAPDDKATLRLNLILPREMKVVANGQLLKQINKVSNKTFYQWEQKTPVPTFIFGFAAGPFRETSGKYGKIQLRYLAAPFTSPQLKRIFADTADMMKFYEKIAGVKYSDSVYTQVLTTGNPAQEMSSFTVMGEDYGRAVLKDKREIWLTAHELAHQWWGNMVTCRDWRHFWLNEGMANFMVAAYKEHRFGRTAYSKEIANLRASYEKVKNAGKDKSLVFPDWNKPSREDRTLVYDKGAYVLHLLREELGDKDFWKAIKVFTQRYWGRSVTTKNFQTSVEQTTAKDLSKFFAKWIYLTDQ